VNNDIEINSKKIHLLPEHLIDQIKAGEVVERPAAVIKELLENSIDAKAKNIDLHLINNGLDLIALIDDGEGIDIADLPYAFCRHATSKISRFEDLYSLHSYGFRGEALASISSISRMQCSSMPIEGVGGKIIIHGGEHKSLAPFSASKHGTSLYIKDLFYNTPARLKFIRSKTHELISLKKTINIFLCSHHEINFSVKFDDKDKIFYPAQKTLKNRLEQLISKKNDLVILHSHKNYEGHEIDLYFSKTPVKSNQKHQYLFANERFFVDKNLHQALLRSIEALWGEGQSGHYFVFLKVPPSELDVNVHPSKTTIKFLRPALVFSLISAGAKEHLIDIPPPASNGTVSHSDLTKPDLEKKNINSNGNNFFLTETYFVFTRENKQLLASTKTFFVYMWEKILHNNYSHLKEEDVTPLLISEPYLLDHAIFSNKQKILLKELGLDTSENSNILIIKTYPSVFKGLPLKEMLLPILDLVIKEQIPTKNEIKIALSSITPSKSLANFISQINTLPENLTVELTDQILSKILKNEII
jgi:DNA mismatch repair protein MutL